ncbi:MobP2 family relaxase [Roseburia hominis]
MGNTPGVVVRNKFVAPTGTKGFGNYLWYKDRAEAKRESVLKKQEQFEEYMESYMGNPEKSTGLFTAKRDSLSKAEMKKWQGIFEKAQANGSLLWQPIISFDNSFLEENGMYRSSDHWLDEIHMREYVRNGVKRMLHNENLDHAVWVGSFHYNTDNIHVHLAIVEPMPTRRKKLYERDGKMQEEIVGKFKPSSIKKCRSYITNSILGEKKMNIQINDLIRKSIVAKKKETILHTDVMFQHEFLTIYDQLPKNKSYWNYNNSHMRALKPLIDDLSLRFIQKYQLKEFLELKELIREQNDVYHKLYGKSNSNADYLFHKTEDLYARLGNAILKEMKAYDKELQEESLLKKIPEEIQYGDMPEIQTISDDVLEEYGSSIEDIIDYPDEDTYLEWTKEYKAARKFLYGTKEEAPQLDRAFVEMSLEAERGNVLAMYDLGDMFYHGRWTEMNEEKASLYYEQSFRGLMELDKNGVKSEKKELLENYVSYRIGRMYQSGKGVKQDYGQAFSYYEKSNSKYARYSQGLLWRDGCGVEKNLHAAFEMFGQAAKDSMPYADYELGKMYEKGVGTGKDIEKAGEHYKKALSGFVKILEERPDDKLYYRVGAMYEKGQGSERNLPEAVRCYEKAAYFGNVYANVALGRIYAESGEIDKVKLAVRYLESASEHNQVEAQYALGKLYLRELPGIQDYEKAEHYLSLSAKQGNPYAQYMLGKMYLKVPEMLDYRKAEQYLKQSAAKGFEYADYQLGRLYSYKQSDLYNPEKAESYLRRLAENGNDMSRFALGQLYRDKDSPLYNRSKAMECFRPLAESGNEYAQLQLGSLYLQGGQSRKELRMAEYWFKQAKSLGNEYADNFLKSLKQKSNMQLKGHEGVKLSRAISRLQGEVRRESRRALQEYEFEQSMEQEIRVR